MGLPLAVEFGKKISVVGFEITPKTPKLDLLWSKNIYIIRLIRV